MSDMTYEQRRGEIAHYFDRTAVAAWEKLTSDAPVGRIRASVRAGRDQMRATIVSWLGEDLTGKRVLDAGCGTGALAVEAARRGAEVVAIDLSPTLVDLARERIPADVADRVTFKSGDMLGKELGTFDHVVAMDSIIHYQIEDAIDALSQLADRTSGSIIFTFAPRTPLLAAMISIGRLLPKSDRAPWLQPMAEKRIAELMDTHETLEGWT
ncbi:MAG: magnesium protoporphyrin IX methyltransferase, partial [Burkholderiaceae bacterium]|nr:magnesium protoporphyrin IX methyltransferase [Burkholderiaceae bacterium]